MTLTDARLRDRRLALISLAGLIGLLVISAITNSLIGSTNRTQASSDERLFPGLAVTPKAIRITTAETNYTLNFDQNAWVIPSKASFPVETDKVVELLNAIQTARFEDARTSIESRHAILGLGDPRQGGNGAMIDFPDTTIRPVILGRRQQTDYGRRANENKSWTIDTRFPALHSPEYWLNFDLIGLPTDAPIASVVIQTSSTSTPVTVNANAPDLTGEDRFLLQASTDMRLLDVTSFQADTMRVFASHRVEYEDGKDLLIELVSLKGGLWARLSGTVLPAATLTRDRLFKLDPLSASELLPNAG